MKHFKSIKELDALVEKHSPTFPAHLADVGNFHPSHGERRTNAQALKPDFLRFCALRMEMTTTRSDADLIWESTQNALESTVNRGDINGFRLFLRNGLKRQLRLGAGDIGDQQVDGAYAEAVRNNMFLIMGNVAHINPARPSAEQLRLPAQQVQFTAN